MIIQLIRHGDPNYELDALTEEGREQAMALVDHPLLQNAGDIYSSPNGRAFETSQPLAHKHHKEVVIQEWLREMDDVSVYDEGGKEVKAWNINPTKLKTLNKAEGIHSSYLSETDLVNHMEEIKKGLRDLLIKYGIAYENGKFILEDRNKLIDSIVLFSHNGLGTSLISILLDLDLLDVWRSVYLSTSSVTSILIEELPNNEINFRIIGLSDVSHLYSKGLPPSYKGLQFNQK